MSGALTRGATTTIVAVASDAPLDDLHDALDVLARTFGVRPVVVTLGDEAAPRRSDRNGTTMIEGLVPRYLNNLVASLRLSSLPTLGWWRAPSTDGLRDLADLVDRLVLDVDDPTGVWALMPELSGRAPVSDLRWTRLTRWRDLFAQFFNLADVRQASPAFAHLAVAGRDPHAARLLAGWITSRLPGGERLEVSIEAGSGAAAIQSLRLSGAASALSLRLLPGDACVETAVTLPGTAPCSRVVPAGDQRLAALLGEELRVRSRDIAFEDAVAAAGGIR